MEKTAIEQAAVDLFNARVVVEQAERDESADAAVLEAAEREAEAADLRLMGLVEPLIVQEEATG
jgi:hypothetical protein